MQLLSIPEKSVKKPPKAVTPPRNTLGRKVIARWQLYLLIAPALIYILLFCYKPMYGVIIAFKDYSMRKGIWGSKWIGFDHFDRLFKSYWFPIILKNTVVLSAISIFLTFPLPIILALLVNEIRNSRLRKGFQIVSYAPHFISTVVVCSMITLFLNKDWGIIGHVVRALGAEYPDILADGKVFKWIYTISGIWQGLGWGCIIYIATLSAVDTTLHEAAQIDGASRLQRIWYINIPALMPTIIIMLIMRFGQIMSVGYEKVYLLQNPMNLDYSEVISTYVYKVGLAQASFDFGTAVGLFNSLVNSFFLIVVNKISNKVSGSGLF